MLNNCEYVDDRLVNEKRYQDACRDPSLVTGLDLKRKFVATLAKRVSVAANVEVATVAEAAVVVVVVVVAAAVAVAVAVAVIVAAVTVATAVVAVAAATVDDIALPSKICSALSPEH